MASRVSYLREAQARPQPKWIAAALLGGMTLIAGLGLQAATAKAESCWSVLTYDEKGNIQSATQCGDEAAPGADEDDKRKPLRKEIEPRQALIVNPPVGTETRLRRKGYSVLEKMDLRRYGIRVWVIETPAAKDMDEALRELRRDFPGLTIDTNDLMDLSAGGSASLDAPLPYDRQTVGWGQVPATCGKGLKIGMIDGAIDVDHPALRGQNLHYRSFLKKGRQEAAFDHGTAVAVMLVGKPGVDGQPGGLLPGVELYAANIFEIRYGKEKGNLAAMLRAIDWMAENRVPLVNMSIAGKMNEVMKIVLTRMGQNGMIAVAAAGNEGPQAHPAWPAAHEKVFAVTAIDRRRGVYRFANQGDYIDFAAPGVDIRTLTPTGPKDQSGTSFAAPYVTGMVAIHLMSGYPPDMDRIRASLQRYASDLGDSGKDDIYGYGLIRLRPNCK